MVAASSIPPWLPVLAIQRPPGRQGEQLLALLLSQLGEKGLQVSVLAGNGSDSALSWEILLEHAARCDLIIVDALFTGAPACAVLGVIGSNPPAGPAPGHRFCCRDAAESASCVAAIGAWLTECCLGTPVWGCILIGGRSSRMGRPKHLLSCADGSTWIERAVSRLQSQVAGLVLSGKGLLPAGLADLEQLADIPGVSGPLTGIAAAMRRYPFYSWVLLACDMPDVTEESISWLLAQRRPGTRAVIPLNPISGRSEPLFAWYDFRCAQHVEVLIDAGHRRIGLLGDMPASSRPEIPARFCGAWRNVNRPEEL